MIPTIVETTPASSTPQLKISPLSTPQLKFSPFSSAQKGDSDKEDSRISNSSFSKESTLPQSEERKVKKIARKVSFQSDPEASGKTDAGESSSGEGKSASLPQQEQEDAVPKNERVVSFNKRVRIRKIRQLQDMPLDQLEATYFTENELMEIRSGLRSKIRSLVEQNFQVELHEDCIVDEKIETSFCIRGLEHEFPRGKYIRKQVKMMSRGAVLEEQRLQREFFVYNERSVSTHDTASTMGSFSYAHEDPSLAIADVYRIESKPAVQLALEYAKRDQYVADQIYFAHQSI